MIEFSCANCGQPFKVKDDWAGKRARCKGCGQAVEVPPVTVDPAEACAAFTDPAPVTGCPQPEQSIALRFEAASARVGRWSRWAVSRGLVTPSLAILIALMCWSAFNLKSRCGPAFGLAFWVSMMVAISKFPPLGIFGAIWGISLVTGGNQDRQMGGFFLFLTSAVVAVWRFHQSGKAKVARATARGVARNESVLTTKVPQSPDAGWQPRTLGKGKGSGSSRQQQEHQFDLPKTRGQWVLATVLGLALGGAFIAFRLPADRQARAERDGTQQLKESIRGHWYELDPDSIRLGLKPKEIEILDQSQSKQDNELRIRFLSTQKVTGLSDPSPYYKYFHVYFLIEDGDAEHLRGKWWDERPADILEDKGMRTIRLTSGGNLEFEGEPYPYSRKAQ